MTKSWVKPKAKHILVQMSFIHIALILQAITPTQDYDRLIDDADKSGKIFVLALELLEHEQHLCVLSFCV